MLGKEICVQRLTRDLARPVRSGLQSGQRDLDIGEIFLDHIEIEGFIGFHGREVTER